MKIKIKQQNEDSLLRLETKTNIKEIMINVDIFNPNEETIALAFKRDDISGLVELTSTEFNNIFEEVKKKLHLIKGVKVFRD
jgi:hypothetical protein